jgi:hypothetical protein
MTSSDCCSSEASTTMGSTWTLNGGSPRPPRGAVGPGHASPPAQRETEARVRPRHARGDGHPSRCDHAEQEASTAAGRGRLPGGRPLLQVHGSAGLLPASAVAYQSRSPVASCPWRRSAAMRGIGVSTWRKNSW